MEYLSHTLNLALIYVVLTVSLNLILGYGGLASMAHGAFFCIGGYISVLVSMHWGVNFAAGMAAAVVLTSVFGGLLAAPFIRVQEEYLILFTIAFQMIIFYLMLSAYEITGGDSGIFGVPGPALFGWTPESPSQFLPIVLVFTLLVYAVALQITRSPFGRVLKGIREDETAVRSLGKNVIRFKILIFMVGTGIAAGVGALFAHYTRFISPATGSLDESILIIAMVVLGGMANLWGSAVGAFLLIIIPEILNFLPGASGLIIPLRGFIYGALLILFMRFKPEGLVPEYFHLGKARAHRSSDPGWIDAPVRQPAPVQASNPGGGNAEEPLLVAEGLCKSFGGLKAVDRFSMALQPRQITALVGPNGCGKTTAFNLITGFLKPQGGRIAFKGRDITNIAAHRLPQIGIARSWQDVRVFQNMTVLDNVLLACQDQGGERLSRLFFTPRRVRRQERRNRRKAFHYLHMVGLSGKALAIARNLSYAEQKLLAVARLLTTEASVLLLDEPSSGVDPNWVHQFMEIIRELAKAGKTICIVEHNLEVVRNISDTVYFMADGQKIAQGGAEELMADPKLGEIYFGI